MLLKEIASELVAAVRHLTFSAPVDTVYNPLDYARKPYDAYLDKYGNGRKEVVLVGMNPGPWGMAQTGIPFGEVAAVRDWMGIMESVAQPARMHPKRAVDGFACHRSEVSGRRLWGWAKDQFGRPEIFFERFFVLNYCPLLFIEDSGRNRTPDKLRKSERQELFAVCDRALRKSLEALQPEMVVGMGVFAEKRIHAATSGMPLIRGRITHPSPANPKANRGWNAAIERELHDLGIEI